MCRPEILAPAGNFEKLRFAVLYGADAVYLAGKNFGMRSAADNFTDEELKDAISYCHDRNVRVYVTVNIQPRPEEEAPISGYLKILNELLPDAIIISDLGVLEYAKKYAPNLEIHISTQANTVNSASCRMWHSLGAKRVVLSRELSLPQICEIRKNTPKELQLEAFVHGAMCVSHSGRCLLSNFFVGRDANHGECAQPCRWEYFTGEYIASFSEKKRPEILVDALQNEKGTFLFSSKDLCMIEHIPELTNAGIDSFKIEGRVKSAYYTAVCANTYKNELMSYLRDKESYKFDPSSLRELESVSHREYCTGYFYTSPLKDAQISDNGGYIREKAFLATVENYDKDRGRATLFQRNKVCDGDEVEIITPGGKCRSFIINDMLDSFGHKIESAPHPKMLYSIKAPFEMKSGDIIRGK